MTKFNPSYRVLASSACAALLLSPLVQTAGAQDARARAETMAKEWGGPLRESLLSNFGGSNRALIGVTTTSGSKADTLGVLVQDVTAGGPADRAGLKSGSRITAVNGVSLRITAADADDPELRDLGQRRLIREIGKAKVGDEVELRVLNGTTAQTLRLKTVSQEALTPSTRAFAEMAPRFERIGLEKRASIGASIGSSGSVRDTLGIFISSVAKDGPAEKAGVIEGDRIAAINGVDVRVSREDAEDYQVASARVNRFTRELAKLTPGDKVTLRVFSDGKYRDVQVTTGDSRDSMGRIFQFNSGDGFQTLRIPGMNFENMPAIIRRSGSDSGRIVYRTVPSASKGVVRSVRPATTTRKVVLGGSVQD